MCVLGSVRVLCVHAYSAIVNGVLYSHLATRGGGQGNLSNPRGLITNTEGNVLNVHECSKHFWEVTHVLSAVAKVQLI